MCVDGGGVISWHTLILLAVGSLDETPEGRCDLSSLAPLSPNAGAAGPDLIRVARSWPGHGDGLETAGRYFGLRRWPPGRVRSWPETRTTKDGRFGSETRLSRVGCSVAQKNAPEQVDNQSRITPIIKQTK